MRSHPDHTQDVLMPLKTDDLETLDKEADCILALPRKAQTVTCSAWQPSVNSDIGWWQLLPSSQHDGMKAVSPTASHHPRNAGWIVNTHLSRFASFIEDFGSSTHQCRPSCSWHQGNARPTPPGISLMEVKNERFSRKCPIDTGA